jgi:hypothetical protein
MSVTSIVEGVEEGLREPQNSRDARVEELWSSLEPDHTGELDLKGLKKGLRRIDHRKRGSLLASSHWTEILMRNCSHEECRRHAKTYHGRGG